MQLIDGKATAAAIRAELAAEVAALRAAHGRAPGLAVILVGEDPASQVYVKWKIKGCEDTGIVSRDFRLPADSTQAEVEALVDRLNADPAIDGILVQLPLPRHMDMHAVLHRVHPAKDVDGFHPESLGRLALGLPTLPACTPAGCMELLRRHNLPTAGKRAVVVGRSHIVGKPVALLLLNADATVTVCHSRTRDLPAVTREADILVAAIGRPKFVTADMVKPGVVVIDVGINRVDKPDGSGSMLVGDCDFEALKDIASAMTPVPGGVGPMTIAMLLTNTVAAFRARMAG